MLEALKFVRRFVSRKDIDPRLKHFRIENGRVFGFNGVTACSAPVDIAFTAAPQAEAFVRALDACDEAISLTLENQDRLLVKSGPFRTSVPCIDITTVPETAPEGIVYPTHTSVLHAFKTLYPFIGFDASRLWSCGIQLRGSSAVTTNNVVLVEYWMGEPFHCVVNIPKTAIDELITVDEELVSFQVSESSITFHYADGRWIKSQLLAVDGPDVLNILNSAWGAEITLKPIPRGLKDACDKLQRFGDKKEGEVVHFRGTDVSTTKEGTLTNGAVVDLFGVPLAGCYYTRWIRDILEFATAADFERYPRPAAFIGDRTRGVICGRRS